jgi:hypothetical protein
MHAAGSLSVGMQADDVAIIKKRRGGCHHPGCDVDCTYGGHGHHQFRRLKTCCTFLKPSGRWCRATATCTTEQDLLACALHKDARVCLNRGCGSQFDVEKDVCCQSCSNNDDDAGGVQLEASCDSDCDDVMVGAGILGAPPSESSLGMVHHDAVEQGKRDVYPTQEDLSAVVLHRVELVLESFGRPLRSFKSFQFCVLTANVSTRCGCSLSSHVKSEALTWYSF